MKVAIDSSVIVAALLSWHESHAAAAKAVTQALAGKDGIVIPSHALFESFAVMTRLPAPHRLASADALALLRDNFASAHIATLGARSVWPTLQKLTQLGLAGGMTYDAIILEAATDAGAAELLTLNARDYERLEPRLHVAGV
jgi:predicted nucleic acid-binding protein